MSGVVPLCNADVKMSSEHEALLATIKSPFVLLLQSVYMLTCSCMLLTRDSNISDFDPVSNTCMYLFKILRSITRKLRVSPNVPHE